MKTRLALLAAGMAFALLSQTQSESNAAYRRYQELARNPAAPLADVLKAADEWLQTYERSIPDPRNLPPYLTLARFYASRGIRADAVLPLLEKGVEELSAPGSFTQVRTRGNSPFGDDIERGLAANIYTQLRLYDKARDLLATAGRTVNQTRPDELDGSQARIFEALRFQYRDGMARLAMAEDRKDEALAWEHAILTNPKNVASRGLIEEHRGMARRLWQELGRSGDFEKWLAGDGGRQ